MKSTILSALVLALLLQTGSGFAATPQSEDLDTVVLEVSGLWAAFCERYLEEALVEPLRGVDRVTADHDSDTVTVRFDPRRLTPEEIAAAIENCPFFGVTGSPTHSLDREEIERQRDCWWCCANRDARAA